MTDENPETFYFQLHSFFQLKIYHAHLNNNTEKLLIIHIHKVSVHATDLLIHDDFK